MFTDSSRRPSLHSDSDTLSPNVSADQLSEPFLASEEKYLSIRRQKPRIIIQALPWILTLFFMTTSIVQFSKQLSPLCGFSKTGIRATDFSMISLQFLQRLQNTKRYTEMENSKLTRSN